MEFTKVKHDGKGVHLKWRTQRGEDSILHELQSFDEPEVEFAAAMSALLPWALQFLGLPNDYAEDARVTGVSISYEEDRYGVVVTILKGVAGANAPLVLNTPHIREAVTDEEMGRPGFFDGQPGPLVEELQHRAARYVNGHREQGSLFEQAA